MLPGEPMQTPSVLQVPEAGLLVLDVQGRTKALDLRRIAASCP